MLFRAVIKKRKDIKTTGVAKNNLPIMVKVCPDCKNAGVTASKGKRTTDRCSQSGRGKAERSNTTCKPNSSVNCWLRCFLISSKKITIVKISTMAKRTRDILLLSV